MFIFGTGPSHQHQLKFGHGLFGVDMIIHAWLTFNTNGVVGAWRSVCKPLFYMDLNSYPYAYADAGLFNLCWYTDWFSSS